MGLALVQSPSAAESLLKPERLRMLELLSEPDSASGVARKLKLPRQTVNYHLKELEREGLVEFVENRLKGNCNERVLRATARSYVISPVALGALAANPDLLQDRFSAAYLASASARAVSEVGVLAERAAKAKKKVPTLTIESAIRFRDAQSRASFTADLLETIAGLVAKYNDDAAPGGRSFRLLVGAWPKPSSPNPPEQASVRLV
ncbi:MAG: helix-turn-helix domain-containing protein [Bryobacteraceae bacterium]|nr:helix-turn-helix domain-containing protein [Bryobacteraceae bacterium]